jgi:formylglycine-generating enzyme required for sulfatase activity
MHDKRLDSDDLLQFSAAIRSDPSGRSLPFANTASSEEINLNRLSLLCTCCLLFISRSLPAAEAVPGIVADKPSEGPAVKVEGGYMVPYTVTIPGTKATFRMIPIPGGTFVMGSPENEEGREADEGPQVRVKVEPFWMGETEVTWREYKEFMSLYQVFKKFEAEQIRLVTEENMVDAITAPTELYEPSFTFEYGDAPELAAVTMTQLAAKHYTKWMSAITGQQFRLPCEAEWEYACRAGTTTAYSFGNDPAKLGEYAWYTENTGEGGQRPVKQKKPNPWGLYDMHGNVAEWVLDEYVEEGYARLADQEDLPALETIAWPDEAWPRVVRGGSWDSEAAGCRSAAKLASNDPDWKANDPNLPLSPWWFTDDPARGVGFRLLRPLKPHPREEMAKFWEIDADDIRDDVGYRLEEGRGVLGIVDRDLPKAIQEQRERAME